MGSAPEKDKEKAVEEVERNLFQHFESLSEKTKENLREHEIPKTREERLLINFANAETNRLRLYFGLQPYNIPEENYHIMPENMYANEFGDLSRGNVHFFKQGIALNDNYARKSLSTFGEVALHETLHLKSYFGLEVEKKETETKISSYRMGISSEASQKERREERSHTHFDGLHEAIVSEQTKKSLKRMIELPHLKKEKTWMQSEAAISAMEKMSERTGLSVDEYIWLDTEGGFRFPYFEQRKVLNYVCEEIQKELPEEYKTEDAVFSVFLGAQLTGRLLPAARLVEQVFGKGSFRILGNMTLEKENTALILDTLRKMRSKNIKNG